MRRHGKGSSQPREQIVEYILSRLTNVERGTVYTIELGPIVSGRQHLPPRRRAPTKTHQPETRPFLHRRSWDTDMQRANRNFARRPAFERHMQTSSRAPSSRLPMQDRLRRQPSKRPRTGFDAESHEEESPSRTRQLAASEAGRLRPGDRAKGETGGSIQRIR